MSAEASVFRCTECGGPNATNARTCTFCRCPLLTLRCAHCFQLNAQDAEFCNGCGEVLGLLPIELPSDLQCPDCKLRLAAFDGDPGLLYDCPSCGGQFIEHDLLFNLIERRRRFAEARRPDRAPSAERQVRYIPCPACKDVMNRRNYGGTSGIIVDYCSRHGVWFHGGELPKLLHHVACGGLADGRRIRLGLAKPLTVEQQKQTAEIVAKAMHDRPPNTTEASSSFVAVAAGVAESGLDLLEVLGNFILDRN